MSSQLQIKLPPVATSQRRRSLRDFADASLKAADGVWFVVAVIGQLGFAIYISNCLRSYPRSEAIGWPGLSP
jgi:hypothetical protein